MKKLIIIICFIFASSISFGQFVKAGYFYEISNLWSMDSVSVKQLLDTYFKKNKLEVTLSVRCFKTHFSSSEKFCLFEFLYREPQQ